MTSEWSDASECILAKLGSNLGSVVHEQETSVRAWNLGLAVIPTTGLMFCPERG